MPAASGPLRAVAAKSAPKGSRRRDPGGGANGIPATRSVHDALAVPGATATTRYGFGWPDLSARTTPRDYGVLASIYARADALPAPYAGILLPLVAILRRRAYTEQSFPRRRHGAAPAVARRLAGCALR